MLKPEKMVKGSYRKKRQEAAQGLKELWMTE
jgi:hypothetical protein